LADKNKRADEEKKRKKSGVLVSDNYNKGGAIARSAGGYTGAAEKYRERGRLDAGRSYPNRRRRIITGRELTTPLVGRARVIEHKKVAFSIKTVDLPKEKMPWGFIIKIFAVGIAACLFVLSYIVLFETDFYINQRIGMIRAAQRETSVLERQFEVEHDSAAILRIARDDFGMVDERYIQKKFITSRTGDRVVIAEGNGGFFPEMFAAAFRIIRRDE
jgi:hypothetical protein